MIKRAIVVFSVLVFAFVGVGFRIADIGADSQQAANTSSAMSMDIAELRGTVYDCELRPLTNAETEIYVAAKPTNQAVALLKENLQPEIFESVKERMSKGKPITVMVDSM
ncbi:hypothetical protein, partial [Klebsiella pneumoniae]|uniref:hypothetical protein n=1 Tax=Klebsiella pneumoniae TaxID=573 RepID=UPI00117BB57A